MSKTITEKRYYSKDNNKRIRVYLSYETGKGYFAIGFQENVLSNGLISCDIFNCGYYKHCIVDCNRPSKTKEKTAQEFNNEDYIMRDLVRLLVAYRYYNRNAVSEKTMSEFPYSITEMLKTLAFRG